jgi:hypothetical protein
VVHEWPVRSKAFRARCVGSHLSVIDVANGANVDVGLAAHERRHPASGAHRCIKVSACESVCV